MRPPNAAPQNDLGGLEMDLDRLISARLIVEIAKKPGADPRRGVRKPLRIGDWPKEQPSLYP